MNPNCNKVVVQNFVRLVVQASLFLFAFIFVASYLGSSAGRLASAQTPTSNATSNVTSVTSPESEIPSNVFAIRVVDAETKRGVPLVHLKTIHHLQYVTDNLGWVAIDDVDLLDRSVFFTIESPGYAFAKDGFGFSGTRLDCTPGESATLEIKRIQLAERMYRSTGVARYVHTHKLNLLNDHSALAPSSENPSIGCDSVLTATLGDKLYWFWGDTSQLHYPIGGSFHMSGATTLVPDAQGSIRGIGLDQAPPDFSHWVDKEDRSKPMARMPGEGPSWLLSLATIRDQAQPSSDSLFAPYVKIKEGLQAYRWGFAKWNSQTESFEHQVDWDRSPDLFPQSQAHVIEYVEKETKYLAFCSPIPDVRVLATAQAFIEPSQYEGYTCLQDGTKFSDRKLDRDAQGKLVYRWRRATRPLSQQEERQLVEEKLMAPEERLCRIIDIDSGKEVTMHNGSVAWNPSRNRWCMVFTQLQGDDSMLGNIYYSESIGDAVGPWRKAKLIARHPNYSFYNPKLHPEFFQENGRVVFFEGTYTHTFSGNTAPTPRYDYNQLIYRLNLESQSWLAALSAD